VWKSRYHHEGEIRTKKTCPRDINRKEVIKEKRPKTISGENSSEEEEKAAQLDTQKSITPKHLVTEVETS